jgi:DNA end-binding protein Ku
MASIWKGAISFGLVNIPVELRAAVRTGGESISFRQLHKTDLSPIHNDRVCDADGEKVPWSDIVKGYEYTKGKFVVVTDEEIKSATRATARALEILDFVRAEEIDPRYFETPYFVVPQKGGERAYALLREAMRKTGMAGIGKFSLRQKEQLASLKPVGDALVLEIMRFATELTDPAELTFPATTGVKPQELRMAEQLIESLSGPFEPAKYRDDYHEHLMGVINAKLKGKKIDVDEPAEPAGTEVIDLMARLQESLAKGRARTGAKPPPAKEPASRRGAAKAAGARPARPRRSA